MDIGSLYILLKIHQNKDRSVTCTWDFSDSLYYDPTTEDEQDITPELLKKQAIYSLDNDPLFIQLPKEIKLEDENIISDTYKARNGYFTVGEILEAVRSSTEKICNIKYTDKNYIFDDLYFTGLRGCCGPFQIIWERANARNSIFQLSDEIF